MSSKRLFLNALLSAPLIPVGIVGVGLSFAVTAPALAADQPLSIKVLKAERSGNVSYLLFSVENSSDRRYESTRWSCIFLSKGDPVHEEESSVDNVPPHGRAVKREIQNYGGPFDKVECRFMNSRPSSCP